MELAEVARGRKVRTAQVALALDEATASSEGTAALAESLHENGFSLVAMMEAMLPPSHDHACFGIEARLQRIEALLHPTREPLPGSDDVVDENTDRNTDYGPGSSSSAISLSHGIAARALHDCV